ncbi:hypothetical protein JMJ56_31975 [Belnapia sp. T18]|uniref:Uncharacterized protein n=1 Tax=Belnapia arida TaxID=2804533 RepID=A0ABS1UEK1_9PROT|nr:glycosyltransferase [Belnapia arida]MBL6082585.1 hypothetical protein [Belnapia arida]
MKVVFAIDRNGLMGELEGWLKLAIDSVKTNTSLEPVVLVDEITESFAAWLDGQRVSYLQAKTPLAEKIDELTQTTGYPAQAKGNYLRYEAVNLLSDSIFLYADCDVVFLKDPTPFLVSPRLVAAAPADIPFSYSSFNSGVLLFNRDNFSRVLEDYYNFSRDNLSVFFPGFDQASFNKFLAGRIEALSAEFNWRPHWGANSNCTILHFHGVKIQTLEMALNGLLAIQGAKSEQVLDLTAKTLTNLPFFIGRIGRDLVDRHPLLQRLEKLSQQAVEILSAPLLSSIRHGVRLRAESEAGIRDKFERRSYVLHVESKSVAPKRIELEPALHKKLRIVIQTEAPSIAVSGLYNSRLEKKFEVSHSVNGNVIFKGAFECDGIVYTNIQPTDIKKPFDFIFDAKENFYSGNDGNHLLLFVMSLTPVFVEFYWSDSSDFSSDNVKFVFVK